VHVLSIVIIGGFIICWGFLGRELLTGKLTGNFSPPVLTRDFVQYKNLLTAEPGFSRVLWIPEYDRFAYGSNSHPFVDANSIIKDSSPSSLITMATSSAFLTRVRGMGVKYIAIATDEAKKLYINDYKFDPSIRQMYQTAFAATELSRVPGFDTLHLYSLESSAPLFLDSMETPLRYTLIDSTKYRISFTGDRNVKFLMAFDPNWRLVVNEEKISAVKTPDGFMSFTLLEEQIGTRDIEYLPQRYAVIGAYVSGITLVLICLILVFL
jgi:hypothetical protein